MAMRCYEEVEPHTIFCNHGEVEDYIIFTKKQARINGMQAGPAEEENDEESKSASEKVTLSLLQKGGGVASRSGLNWGQRPEESPIRHIFRCPPALRRAGFSR